MTNRKTTVRQPLALRAGDIIVADPDPASPTYRAAVDRPVADLPVGSNGDVAVEYVTSSGEHDTLLLPADEPVTIELNPRTARVAAAIVLADLAGRDDLPRICTWRLDESGRLEGQLGVPSGHAELARWAEFLDGAAVVERPRGSTAYVRISVTADYQDVPVYIWGSVEALERATAPDAPGDGQEASTS